MIINNYNLESAKINEFSIHLLNMVPKVHLSSFINYTGERHFMPYTGKRSGPGGYVLANNTMYLAAGIPRLSHEIAHLVEMSKPKRWTQIDFGFPEVKSDYEPGYVYFVRETRVRCIEHILLDFDFKSKLTPVIPKMKIPFGKHPAPKKDFLESLFPRITNINFPIKKFNSYISFSAFLESIYDTTKKKYDKDRIEHDWKIRIDYIKNFMETEEHLIQSPKLISKHNSDVTFEV
jgi:hypothetical protein